MEFIHVYVSRSYAAFEFPYFSQIEFHDQFGRVFYCTLHMYYFLFVDLANRDPHGVEFSI